MKVFISWSKPQSRAVAELFRVWLPRIIQQCRDPFMSTETAKGDAWFGTITTELRSAKVGVVFITPENQDETWLNFESGAMLTKFEAQRLLPVLVGLKKADYSGPLKNLQLTEFEDVEDMRRLLKTINQEVAEPLDSGVLSEDFDLRWIGFKEAADAALAPLRDAASSSTDQERSPEDKIDEILTLLRDMHRNRDTGIMSPSSVRLRSHDRSSSSEDYSALRSEWDRKKYSTNTATLDKIARVVAKQLSDATALASLPGKYVIEGGRPVGEVLSVSKSEGGEAIEVQVQWDGDRPDSFELVDDLELAPF